MNHRIWILLDSRGQGGIETHVEELAVGWNSGGQDVSVVFFRDYGPHPLRDRLRQNGIRVMTAGSISGLFQLIRSGRPDLVHTHGYKCGILGRLLARLFKIAVVSTFHAGEPGDFKIRTYQAIDRLTARISTNIAVSEQIARKLPRGTRVMDNFVRVPPYPAWSETNAGRIAFVGRLSEEKGADTFMEIARRHPSLRFDVYGDGPMRSTLEALGLANVTFHGMQPGMQDTWRNIGLLCMPSRFEGLPMAALEAMAHGIPVACFAVGALPELIEDNVNGFAVPPGDMDHLSYRIIQWSRIGPSLRSAMSLGARRTIQDRYSVERILPQVIGVYANALGDAVTPKTRSAESGARNVA